MKKVEAKTTLLLVLPALALVGFASILSLRSQKRDFGSPYRIIQHEVVTEGQMTAKEKKIARLCHVPVGQAVCYRYDVEAHTATFWRGFLFGDKSYNVWTNGSSCVEVKTRLSVAPQYSGSAGERRGMREIYDRRLLNNGDVIFSFPLTWSDGQSTHAQDHEARLAPNLEVEQIMVIIEKPETLEHNEQPDNDGEFPKPLSERDSIRLIEMLENPPEPNEALKKAVARYRKMAVRR